MINLNILDAEVLNKLQYGNGSCTSAHLSRKYCLKMVDLKSHGPLTLQFHAISTKVVMLLLHKKLPIFLNQGVKL